MGFVLRDLGDNLALEFEPFLLWPPGGGAPDDEPPPSAVLATLTSTLILLLRIFSWFILGLYSGLFVLDLN